MTVQADRLRVLLIEDSPGDARLLTEALADAPDPGGFDVTCVDRVADAVRSAATTGHDIVLLDLSLPDAAGIDAVRRLREALPDVPVVVLTGLADQAMAVRALAAGAQDYLIKGEADGWLLARAMRYAVERHRMLSLRQREERSLERLSGSGRAADAVFGEATLATALPDTFDDLVRVHAAILTAAALDSGGAEASLSSEALRALADRLGLVRATPGDILALQAAALHFASLGSEPRHRDALGDAARVLAVELMGHLAAHYRRLAVGGEAATRQGATVTGTRP